MPRWSCRVLRRFLSLALILSLVSIYAPAGQAADGSTGVDDQVRLLGTGVNALPNPAITSPASGASYEKANLTIRWTAVSQAVSYVVAVLDVNTNRQIVTDVNVGLSTSYTVSGSSFTEGHQYKAAVGVNYKSSSSWNPGVYFNIYPPLGQPQVIEPSNQSLFARRDVAIRWTAVSTAQYYLVAVLDQTTGVQIVRDENVGSSTVYTLAASRLSDGHQYKVAVGAYRNSNNSWSPGTYFTIQIAAPTVTAPENGTYVEKADVVARWTSVPGASGYTIAVLDVNTNSQIAADRDAGMQTSFTISGGSLTAGHQYKIAVATRWGGGPASWSGGTYFTVYPDLQAPSLVAPENNAILDKGDISVQWTSVATASNYLVSVVRTRDNLSVVSNVDVGKSTSYVIAGSQLTIGERYKIQAAAVRSGTQKWSDAIYITVQTPLTAPVITAPANNAMVEKADVVVKWNAVQTADHYVIAVRDDADPLNQIIPDTDCKLQTSFTIPGAKLLAGHKYKIWLAAYRGSKEMPAISYFTVYPPLTKPAVTQPVPEAKVEKTDLTIKWSSVANAGNYVVAVLDVAANKQVVADVNVNLDTSYILKGALLESGKRYKIAIGAYRGTADQAWSDPVYFTVLPALQPPVITAPAADAAFEKEAVTVQWNSVPTATGYTVTVYNVTESRSVVTSAHLTQLSYTIDASLLPNGKRYKVNVSALRNGISVPSADRFFTVREALGAPAVTAPANNAMVEKADVVVKWNAVATADRYVIAVRDDADPVNQLIPDTDCKLQTSFTIPGAKLVAGHKYKVWVAAYRGKTEVATVSYFTVYPPLGKPAITQPAPEANLEKVDLTIKWNAVPNAGYYLVAVLDVATNVQIVKDVNVKLDTSFLLKGSQLEAGKRYKVAIGVYRGTADPAWSDPVFFSVLPTLQAPVVTAPAANATLEKEAVAVQWNSVPSATSYTVTVYNVTDNKSVGTSPTLAQPSYTIDAAWLSNGKRYKLNVSALRNGISVSSTDRFFTVRGALGTPAVTAPAKDAMVEKADVVVKWNAVATADRYVIAVRDDADQVNQIVPDTDVKLQTSFTIPGAKLIPGHKYKVWVAAYREKIEMATVTYFTVYPPLVKPAITQPTVEAKVEKVDLTIKWNAVPNAGYYVVAVLDVAAAKQIVKDVNVKLDTSFPLKSAQLEAGKRYKIAVGAHRDKADPAWSDPVFFNVLPALDVPGITAPAADATFEKEAVPVQWNSVPTATGYTVTVYNATDKKDVVTSPVLTQPAYTIDASMLTNGKRYKVTVNALRGGVAGPGTDRYFKVRDALGAPKVTAPKDDGMVELADVVVKWDSVATADRYIIAVRDVADPVNQIIPDTDCKLQTSFTIPAAKLLAAHKYKVWVAARRGVVEVPTVIYFTVYPPLEKPVMTWPANNSMQEKADLPIQWTGPAGVEYLLTLQDLTTNKPVPTGQKAGAATAYVVAVDKLADGHKYQAQVVATRAGAKQQSDPSVFTILAAPQPPVITAPANNAAFNPGDVTVQWTAAGTDPIVVRVIDLAGNQPILSNAIASSSPRLTIPGVLLTEGHQYSVQAGAVRTGLEPKWSPAVRFSIKWPVTASSAFPAGQKKSITRGEVYTFPGTLTSNDVITTVTVTVANTEGFVTDTNNATTYDLKRLAFDTRKPEFSTPGLYTLNLWAKTTAYDPPHPLATMQMEVKPGVPPQLIGFPNKASVVAGTRYALQGRVESKTNLQYVRAMVRWTDAQGVSQYYHGMLAHPKDTKFDLSGLSFVPAKDGTYTIELFAASDGWTGDTPLGKMSLTTVNTAPPTVANFEQYAKLTLGHTYALKGTIKSNSPLTRVTVQVPGVPALTQSATLQNKPSSYGLEKFTLDTGKLPDGGVYLAQVWAATVADPDPAYPIGTLALEVTGGSNSQGSILVKGGYRLLGFRPNQGAVIYTGMGYQVKGVLVSDTPLWVVNLVVRRPDGQSDNHTFRTDARGNLFDLKQFVYSALGDLGVPGSYTLELWATAQNQPDVLLDQFTLTVKSPLTQVDGYYVASQDRVYLAAWVDSSLIAASGGYPTPYAVLYDGDQKLGEYNLDRLGEGTAAETYIPAPALHPGKTLTVYFLVRGYEGWTYRSVRNTLAVKTVAVPQPSWSIRSGAALDMRRNSEIVTASADTTAALPSGYKLQLGISTGGGFKYFNLAAQSPTHFASTFRLADLGLKAGATFKYSIRIVGWGIQTASIPAVTATVPVPLTQAELDLQAQLPLIVQSVKNQLQKISGYGFSASATNKVQALVTELSGNVDVSDPVIARKVDVLRRIQYAYVVFLSYYDDADAVADHIATTIDPALKASLSSMLMISEKVRFADPWYKSTNSEISRGIKFLGKQLRQELNDPHLEEIVNNLIDKVLEASVDWQAGRHQQAIYMLLGTPKRGYIADYFWDGSMFPVLENELRWLNIEVTTYTSTPLVPLPLDLKSASTLMWNDLQSESFYARTDRENFDFLYNFSELTSTLSDELLYSGVVASPFAGLTAPMAVAGSAGLTVVTVVLAGGLILEDTVSWFHIKPYITRLHNKAFGN